MVRKSTRIKESTSQRKLPARATRSMVNMADRSTSSLTSISSSNSPRRRATPKTKPTPHRRRLFGLEEAPTFYPTEEQFRYPGVYIASVRKYSEPYGMCKIVPPASFRPGFAPHSETFRLSTEKQKLNYLGAFARSYNNFFERLRAFQEQNGFIFKQPTFYSRALDLYQLKKLVDSNGGYANAVANKLWSKIGEALGYNRAKCTSLSFGLRNMYEAHIMPFEAYTSIILPKHTNDAACVICHTDVRNLLFQCEVCARLFHGRCLQPKITQRHSPAFYCSECLLDYSPPFGFDAGGHYSLREFQSVADTFKSEYMQTHASERELAQLSGSDSYSESWVERKFWEQIEAPMHQASVENASDLPTSYCGSGFATAETSPDNTDTAHPWNLNNLACNPSNLLAHLEDSDSGMTTPWIYIAMLFSTFCWRTEDHFTYSINYHHWGSPKSYYSVPGSHMTQFQDAFQRLTPSLFKNDPDLLYQLVTMMSPASLKKEGVPVYAATQRPGEFIVTFPKTFYCGFSHGFNFSEAINFSSVDWLPHGQDCVVQYKKMLRPPVFSHDELLCHIASITDDLQTAEHLHQPLLDMLRREEKGRASLKLPTRISENPLNTRQTNIPQCLVCNAYCYLSVITCHCSNERAACIAHANELCSSHQPTLLIKVTKGTLEALIARIALMIQPLALWRKRYLDLVSTHRYPKLTDMEALLAQAANFRHLIPEAISLDAHVKLCANWVKKAQAAMRFPSRPETCYLIKSLLEECKGLSFTSPEIDTLRQLRRDISNTIAHHPIHKAGFLPSPPLQPPVTEPLLSSNSDPFSIANLIGRPISPTRPPQPISVDCTPVIRVSFCPITINNDDTE